MNDNKENDLIGQEEGNNDLNNAVLNIYENQGDNKNNKSINVPNPYPVFDSDIKKEIDSPFKENKKNNKFPANPPKYPNDLVESTETFKERPKPAIEEFSASLNREEFQKIQKGKLDKRNICDMWKSITLSNSTIYFVFFDRYKDYESIFMKGSLIIILFSLYLFINTMIVFNRGMILLYSEYFEFGNFVFNIFLTLLTNIIIIVIKKYLALREFIYEIILENEKSRQEKNITCEDLNRRILDKINENNKYGSNKKIYIYGIIFTIFLIFNCILVTSFCGVYQNSLGNLILNTLMGVIFTSIIYALFYLVGAILRYYSFKKNSEIMYNISRFFDPLHLSIDEILKMKGSFLSSLQKKRIGDNLKDRPAEL